MPLCRRRAGPVATLAVVLPTAPAAPLNSHPHEIIFVHIMSSIRTNLHKDGYNRTRGQGQATVPTRPEGSLHLRIAPLEGRLVSHPHADRHKALSLRVSYPSSMLKFTVLGAASRSETSASIAQYAGTIVPQ